MYTSKLTVVKSISRFVSHGLGPSRLYRSAVSCWNLSKAFLLSRGVFLGCGPRPFRQSSGAACGRMVISLQLGVYRTTALMAQLGEINLELVLWGMFCLFITPAETSMELYLDNASPAGASNHIVFSRRIARGMASVHVLLSTYVSMTLLAHSA